MVDPWCRIFINSVPSWRWIHYFRSVAERTREKLLRFCGSSNSLLYINTLVPGDVAEQLSKLQIPVITHVHELENAIKRWCVKEELEQLIGLTDHFIAASPPVARNLEIAHQVSP